MELPLLIKALILGIVEGLTEFLPISSTGHLILAGDLLDFNDEAGKVFEIVIQFGAILAVIWEYRARLWETVSSCTTSRKSQRFLINVGVAFLPLAGLGFLFHKTIKAHLFNPISVAAAFIIGGLIIFWAERRQHHVRVPSVDDMTLKDALMLGCIQALALIPGTSRSGATIIGGLLMGLSRKAATEFSFFLAIPTLGVATVYQVYKEWATIQNTDLGMWAVGFASAFISAFLCIRWLLRYITTHNFIIFAWYRIIFGVVVLVTAYTGLVSWSAH